MKTHSRFVKIVALSFSIVSGEVGALPDELDNWTLLNPTPVPPVQFQAVIFDGEQFVAVGDGGFIVTSKDGKKWQIRNSGTDIGLLAVDHDEGVYIAGGRWGHYLRSIDLARWHESVLPTNSPLLGLCHGNGVFLMTGGVMFRSENTGISWTELASPGGTVEDCIFGDGRFVIVGRGIYTSEDGLDWTLRDSNKTFFDVAYGDGKFVAVGASGTDGMIASSPNGIDWFIQYVPYPLYGVTYGDGQFVTAGGNFMSSGNSLVSTDGVYFEGSEPAESGLGSAPLGVAFGNGVYVGVGQGMLAGSDDGLTWINSIHDALEGYSSIRRVVPGNGKLVMPVKRNLVTTDDGAQFKIHSFPGRADGFWFTAFNGDTFVAGGGTAPMMVSEDGERWVAHQHDTNAFIVDMTVAEGVFYGCGGNGVTPVIVRSQDGMDWTTHELPNEMQLGELCYGNGVFLSRNNQGQLFASFDGVNWATHSTGSDQFVGRVRFAGNRFFVLADPQSGCLISEDAVTWTQTVPEGDWIVFRDVAYGNGRYVAATEGKSSSGRSIRSSTDGLTWINELWFSPRLETIIYANHAFFAVGGSTVLRSYFSNIPRFEAFDFNATELSLQISGEIGLTYQIQKSGNLTNWTDVTTFTNLNRSEIIGVPFDPGAGNQFWRARTP